MRSSGSRDTLVNKRVRAVVGDPPYCGGFVATGLTRRYRESSTGKAVKSDVEQDIHKHKSISVIHAPLRTVHSSKSNAMMPNRCAVQLGQL